MADFDEAFDAQLPKAIPIPGQDRLAFLENQFQYLYAEVSHLRGVANQPPPPPPPHPRPNLNLPTPSKFSGIPSELPMFKLKLYQFLMGNYNTYIDSESQILFAGSLLEGSAGQWYSTLADPTTLRLPLSYTLDSFWQELEGLELL